MTPENAQVLIERALQRWGATERLANCVAAHLVDADRSGHPSHGSRQLLRYRQQLEADACRLDRDPVVTRRDGLFAEIDAQGSLGHLAMHDAVNTAIEITADHDVGICSVVRLGHAGRMGAWAEQGAQAGCVTIVFLAAVGPPFILAAEPGASPILATNPLTIGVPAQPGPLVIDMAMSAIAEGKVMIAAARNEPLPDGAVLDQHGATTTNAADFYAGGALLPAAGYKGFGLAAIIEAIAVSVIGADRLGYEPCSGALVITMKAGAFRPVNDLLDSLAALRARVNNSGTGGRRILAPGEYEFENRRSQAFDLDQDVLHLIEA